MKNKNKKPFDSSIALIASKLRVNKKTKIKSKILEKLLSATIVLIMISISGCFLLPRKVQASSINSQNIIDFTNSEREKNGLDTLSISNILASAAQEKAQDMISRGYFEHTGPDGKKPWDWIKNAGYSYIYAGENLAIDFRSAEGVVKAWMESEAHKDNIIDSDYKEIGIGVAQGDYKGKNSIIVVQMFGSPDNKVKSQNSSSDNSQLVQNSSENIVSFLKKRSSLFVNVFKNSLLNNLPKEKENNILFGSEEGNSLLTIQAVFTGIMGFVF